MNSFIETIVDRPEGPIEWFGCVDEYNDCVYNMVGVKVPGEDRIATVASTYTCGIEEADGEEVELVDWQKLDGENMVGVADPCEWLGIDEGWLPELEEHAAKVIADVQNTPPLRPDKSE